MFETSTTLKARGPHLLCGSLNLLVLVPPASPKLFLDSSSPCSTLPALHPSLHSPLTRQLSTSSENSTPLGPGSQSICSTPVRVRSSARLGFHPLRDKRVQNVFICPPAAANQTPARRELLRHQQHRHPHVCRRHHPGGEAAVQRDPHAQVRTRTRFRFSPRGPNPDLNLFLFSCQLEISGYFLSANQ